MPSGVELATAYVSLSVSAKGMATDINNQIGRVDGAKAGRKVGKGFSTGIAASIKKAAPIAAALATYGGYKFFATAISQASDLGEEQSKANVIFGEGARQVEEFSRRGGKALGQSQTDVLASAATFGTFGKAAGLTGNDLATFSTDFTTLAADLASFNNSTPEEATLAIGAALRGEAEPIRNFGVLLDDATLRNRALKLGLIETTKEALTPQQKVLAAQAEIYAQTGDAQGDFARTSGGLANQQRILSAQFTDLKAKIGAGLLPVVEKFAGFLTGTALPSVLGFVDGMSNGTGAGGKFLEGLTRLREGAVSAFGYFKSDVLPRLIEFGTYIRETVIPAVISLAGWVRKNSTALTFVTAAVLGAVVAFKAFMIIKAATTAIKAARVAVLAFNASLLANPIGIVIAVIGALVGVLVVLYKKNDTARRIMNAAWAGIKAAIRGVVNWFRDTAWPILRNILQWAGDKAMWLYNSGIKPAFNNIRSKISSLVTWVRDVFWPTLRDRFTNLRDKAMWLYNSGIKPAFNNVRDKVQSTKDKLASAFNSIKIGVGKVKDAFASAKDGIARVWGKVTSAVSSPIRDVLKYINDKFIGGINKLLDKIPGVSLQIPLISIPATLTSSASTTARGGSNTRNAYLAAGGRVPGYSPSATADNIPAMLTAGEYVLPVKATDRLRSMLGGAGLESLRRGSLPAFANGGPVGGSVADLVGSAASGIFDFAKDPVGTVKKTVNGLLGGIGNSLPGVMAKGALGSISSGLGGYIKDLFTSSASKDGGNTLAGKGSPLGGWRGQWNLIKSVFPGAGLSSSVRPGAITASGYRSYHGLSRAVDLTGSQSLMRTMFNWIQSNFGASSPENYFGPGGSAYRYGKKHYLTGVTAATHPFNHVHWALANGGLAGVDGKAMEPKLFDSGGTLDVGWNRVYNGTGAPEHLTRTDQIPTGPTRLHEEDLRFLASLQGQQFGAELTKYGRTASTRDRAAGTPQRVSGV